MYSFIQGSIQSVDDDRASIMVDGIWLGFEVFLSPHALAHTLVNERCAFPLYHHRTEVSDVLFWFKDHEERLMFQKLLKVSGIGGKTALSLLGLGIDTLVQAIELHDDTLLSSVPWIGKKTAQKIVVELSGTVSIRSLLETGKTKEKNSTNIHLIASLTQMGYEKSRVESVVASLSPTLSLEAKTVEAIRTLSRK